MNFCAVGIYIDAGRVVDEGPISAVECVVAQESIRSVGEVEASC